LCVGAATASNQSLDEAGNYWVALALLNSHYFFAELRNDAHSCFLLCKCQVDQPFNRSPLSLQVFFEFFNLVLGHINEQLETLVGENHWSEILAETKVSQDSQTVQLLFGDCCSFLRAEGRGLLSDDLDEFRNKVFKVAISVDVGVTGSVTHGGFAFLRTLLFRK
jgi:hypothetical protein